LGSGGQAVQPTPDIGNGQRVEPFLAQVGVDVAGDIGV